MKEYSHYKEWLFKRILDQINAHKRINYQDITFVKDGLNKKFEGLTKNGWIGKPFSQLEEKLRQRGENLVKKFEEIDEYINEEINNQLGHLSRIQLN